VNTIEFSTPVLYSADTSSIPLEWLDASFSIIDFTGKEKLKDFMVEFFRSFSYSKDDSRYDSLVFTPNDFAFQLLIATYNEVAARITVDNYRFFVWPTYAAMLRGIGFKADNQLQEDLFGIKFLFIFDLVFYHKDSIDYFCSILDCCYSNRIKLFISMRNAAALESLPAEYINMVKDKLYTVKVK
jgi:predicted membrane protein